ncbi:MAG: TonB-dependent receptor, partial [Gemmatimonadaceae bacterium]
MNRFFLSLLASSLAAPLLEAQQAPVPDSARVRLPAVTVTATRSATPIYTVPLAVSVISRKDLDNKRGYSLDEAISSVPGVLAQSR